MTDKKRARKVSIVLDNGKVLKLRVTKLEWQSDAQGRITSITWETSYRWYQRRVHPQHLDVSHIVAIVAH